MKPMSMMMMMRMYMFCWAMVTVFGPTYLRAPNEASTA
jgi:hypothetical protein